jgi:hypothetical protein
MKAISDDKIALAIEKDLVNAYAEPDKIYLYIYYPLIL